MLKVTINDQVIEVPEGYTVLQAAQIVDTEIPVFCFHQRLNIAGNCRMCLVEMKNSPKPIASCAMPITDGMVIYTKTEMVKKARRGVLEFLLINHPLDCPICDQGGECDLQDITMSYGSGMSRYKENKRAVPAKNMGPLVKTFMTRCIHCTRCIRFAKDVAGIQELGAIGRGEHMEITTYLDQAITSELSANIIDLCPVGALTSAPYAFKGRPWELKSTESIDVMDAVGSNIRIDTYNLKVMRILPRTHEQVNEEWLSDKSRYACDGLMKQRLDRPYIRHNGQLEPATWSQAFKAIKDKLKTVKGSQIAAFVGDMVESESILALKDLMQALGSPHTECRQEGALLSAQYRGGYLFNTSIEGLERSDACLIVGANIRCDAPLIHTRLRKRYGMGGYKVAYLGGKIAKHRDLTFPVESLGTDPHVLDQILSGKHPFSKILKEAKNPVLILGMEALTRLDAMVILRKCGEIAEKYKMIRKDWNGFNILHRAANRVGALDLGFVPGRGGLARDEIINSVEKNDIKVLYIHGADELPFDRFEKAFIIYQGHHGDRGAHRADVILPGAAYTEKNGTYVNMEGRVQRGIQALQPPGDAKEDWRIIRALSEVLDMPLPYDTLEALRKRMEVINPIYKTLDQVIPGGWSMVGRDGKLSKEPFAPSLNAYYMTDSISRHSETMARCHHDIDIMAKTKGGLDAA